MSWRCAPLPIWQFRDHESFCTLSAESPQRFSLRVEFVVFKTGGRETEERWEEGPATAGRANLRTREVGELGKAAAESASPISRLTWVSLPITRTQLILRSAPSRAFIAGSIWEACSPHCWRPSLSVRFLFASLMLPLSSAQSPPRLQRNNHGGRRSSLCLCNACLHLGCRIFSLKRLLGYDFLRRVPAARNEFL